MTTNFTPDIRAITSYINAQLNAGAKKKGEDDKR